MDKKSCEMLSDILIYDDRFSSNMHSLEMLNANYNSGDPVEIWMEAMSITNDMAKIEKGRFDIFSNIGKDWSAEKRYAVKKMVVYILDNPTPNISATDKEEMRMMRTEIKHLNVHLYHDDIEIIPGSFAAETIHLSRINKNKVKNGIKNILETGSSLNYELLLSISDCVQTINTSLEGYLSDELDVALALLSKSLTNKSEIESIKNPDESVFTKEQYEYSKIKNTFWLKAMYSLLNDKEYKKELGANENDCCAAFLSVLRYNSEYKYKGGYNDFFNMMRELFKINSSDNDKQNIIRYINENTYNYMNWGESTGMRKIRKKIAKDIAQKKDYLEKKGLENK